jgi:uncharacterized protein (TIGR01777 family)
MRSFTATSTFPVPAAELAAWHFRQGALERLVPGWSGVRIRRSVERMEEGAKAELSVPLGLGVRSTIEAVHREVRPGESFVDEMVRGPFAHWRHLHRFEESARGSRLVDQIEYRLPFGVIGSLAAGRARRELVRMFRWRHARLRHDLGRHDLGRHDLGRHDRARQHPTEPPLTVAISGATGLVGSALGAFLRSGGHTVRRIVRRVERPDDIGWNVERGELDAAALEGVDAVVHLAGATIASRWTSAHKRAVRESRVRGTELLATTLARLKRPPSVLVSASAIGFYGHREDGPVDERAERGSGFLADVCQAWEAAAEPARQSGVRVVHPRIGMVLAAQGGALAAMLTPFRLGLGGPIGGGDQGVSWIALDDLIATILFAMRTPSMVGPYNAAAPEALSQRAFARQLGRVLRRPALAPLPAFVVAAVFGEMGRELLLSGALVRPGVLEQQGFRFAFPDLEAALRFELGRLEPDDRVSISEGSNP